MKRTETADPAPTSTIFDSWPLPKSGPSPDGTQGRTVPTADGPSGALLAAYWEGEMNSGWSSNRSQVPSACLRATCTRAPAPSFGGVEARAISPLTRVGSGGSCSNRGNPESTFDLEEDQEPGTPRILGPRLPGLHQVTTRYLKRADPEVATVNRWSEW
jgi:hypothetical protein